MNDEEDEYGSYSDENVDMYVNEPSDLEDPVCCRCGSTNWAYCTLGDNNKIRKCSDCPQKKELH